MRKLGLALALLLASTAAQAAFITGDMQVGGGSNTVVITTPSPLTGTIGFFPGSLVLPAANGTSGTFLTLVGDAVTFPGQGNPPTPEDFNALTNASLQPFVTAGGLTFTLMTENTLLTNIGFGQEVFSISGTGTFHLSGFTDTPGIFTFSTQSDNNGTFKNTSFSASASAVPGPIVGAGLPGTISMLLGGGWWWRRRKA